MARAKISEYRAKHILLGDSYTGRSIGRGDTLPAVNGAWVFKVDQGVKKRFKNGLLVIGAPAEEFPSIRASWEARGFNRFLLEPLIPHDEQEERYISFERVRTGVQVLYTAAGGVDIETHRDSIQKFLVRDEADLTACAETFGLPQTFVAHLYTTFTKNFFAFMEINPFIMVGEEFHLLDVAVQVDTAGLFSVRTWNEEDLVQTKQKHASEMRVEALAATTPASLKLSILNTDGALFLLLSGGGGSIVVADEAYNEGVASLLANYGEYSGGPTREEVYLYTKEICQLIVDSNAQKKALVIAGGVANFTDIRSTFLGIIDALREWAPQLRAMGVRVFVRRGGPHERAGLALMESFLTEEKLLGSIYGSESILTSAVEDAVAYVRT